MFNRFWHGLTFRKLLALFGGLAVAVSLFVPWIYAFSPPTGPNHEITQIAAPNLVDLVLHSNYAFLAVVPLSLIPGIGLVFIPKRSRRWEIVAAAGALLLSFIPNFEFGLQFGSAIGLVYNGGYVSYSITLGPGSILMEAAGALFFVCLFIAVISED